MVWVAIKSAIDWERYKISANPGSRRFWSQSARQDGGCLVDDANLSYKRMRHQPRGKRWRRFQGRLLFTSYAYCESTQWSRRRILSSMNLTELATKTPGQINDYHDWHLCYFPKATGDHVEALQDAIVACLDRQYTASMAWYKRSQIVWRLQYTN